MRHNEQEGSGKTLIKFIIFGAIALDILYGMATGAGSFTGQAQYMNTSSCPTGNCTASSSPNTLVVLIGGTIVLVLFFLGIAFKFL